MTVRRTEFQQKVDAVKRYMKLRGVSNDLQTKISQWFEYMWTDRRSMDEDSVLDILPETFKAEIATEVHMEVLKRVSIFETCERVSGPRPKRLGYLEIRGHQFMTSTRRGQAQVDASRWAGAQLYVDFHTENYSPLRHPVFIHSFIADICIAPLQVGLLRSAPNPSAAE